MTIITIEFNKESFDCRILIGNGGEELVIGSMELLNALEAAGLDDGDKEATDVDDKIFYYTAGVDMELPDNELRNEVKVVVPEFFD